MQDIYEYLRYTANLIAASEFGNQLVLKGGSVLISKLIECNRLDLYRLTTVLDIHCDKKEVWIAFYTNIENILNNNDRNYIYRIEKRRSEIKGLETSDSLRFSLNDSVEYSPILNMNTYDALTMLSDKIVAVSSDKIYRRIKDLYDITVFASLYSFEYYDIVEQLKIKHPQVTLQNNLIHDNYESIRHAYDKYEGIANKPDIRELIVVCYAFLEPLYIGYAGGKMVWNIQTAQWQEY